VWETRDLTLVIILAVVSFIYTLIIGQLGNLVTGIVGFNYLFAIGHMFFISFGFLMYEGKRWRLFLQCALVALLTLTTYLSGVPFDLLSKIPILLTAFIADLGFNSIYQFFTKRNRLKWLSLLLCFCFLLMLLFFNSLNMYLFYSPQTLSAYLSVYALLLPVSIIETALGGLLGFEIYKKTKKGLVIK